MGSQPSKPARSENHSARPRAGDPNWTMRRSLRQQRPQTPMKKTLRKGERYEAQCYSEFHCLTKIVSIKELIQTLVAPEQYDHVREHHLRAHHLRATVQNGAHLPQPTPANSRGKPVPHRSTYGEAPRHDYYMNRGRPVNHLLSRRSSDSGYGTHSQRSDSVPPSGTNFSGNHVRFDLKDVNKIQYSSGMKLSLTLSDRN